MKLTPTAPTRGSPSIRKRKQQNAVLLVIASLLGVWLGTGAPTISPVATRNTAPLAVPVGPVLPIQPASDRRRFR